MTNPKLRATKAEEITLYGTLSAIMAFGTIYMYKGFIKDDKYIIHKCLSIIVPLTIITLIVGKKIIQKRINKRFNESLNSKAST